MKVKIQYDGREPIDYWNAMKQENIHWARRRAEESWYVGGLKGVKIKKEWKPNKLENVRDVATSRASERECAYNLSKS